MGPLAPLLWAAVAFLVLRLLLKGFFVRVGIRALGKQPDAIELRPANEFAWRDRAKVAAIVERLKREGFVDLGPFTTAGLHGAVIGVLVNESTNAGAYVYEHPKVGVYVEIGVRY